METLGISLDDGTGKRFDEAQKNALIECGDLQFISKHNATSDGGTAVCITFTVVLPDGTMAKAQAVTTLGLIEAAVKALATKPGMPLPFPGAPPDGVLH
jgi:hypothetical protein